MAVVLGKNVSQLNRLRCLRNFVKTSHSYSCIRKQCIYATQTKYLATAAYKPMVKEDFSKNSYGEQKAHKLHNINEALSEIDFTVRRTGRIIRKHVEAVFSMVKNEGTASTTQGLYLLRCCERMLDEPPSERIELAHKIWLELEKLGIQFDVAHYNARLKLYVENEYNFSPGDFLASMEKQNIVPDKVSYYYLMEKFCNDGNLAGASEILECMKEKGIPVNEHVFNCLITGHVNSSDFDGAQNLLKVMRSSNLSPTADSYTALACGYAKKGDIEGVKSCLHFEDKSVKILSHHLLRIINALAVSGQEHIDEVLGMMENNSSGDRQEFINAAVDLIHKGFVDVAYKLIIASADPQMNSGTNIFIKQLIKNSMPIQKILDYGFDISKRGINNYILLNGSRAAIDYGRYEYAVALFEAMLQKGIPVRNYHIWPLFSHLKENNNVEGVWFTLGKMHKLGILPDFVTYHDYVLPVLGILHPKDFITKVEQAGLSVVTAVDALFHFYCDCGEVDYAFYLIKMHPVRVRANFNLKKYLSLYEKFKEDSPTYFLVLKFVLEHIGLPGEVRDFEVLQGNCVAEIIMTSPLLFDAFKKNVDFALHGKSLNVCHQLIKQKTPHLLMHLKNISDSKTHLQRGKETERRPLTIEEEEKHLSYLKEHSLPTRSFVIECLVHHIKKRNIDRVTEIKALLEDEEFIFSPFLSAQLISLYSEANNLDEVQKLMEQLNKNHPTFTLDHMKAIDYATLLIKFEKYEDALKVLCDSFKKMSVQRPVLLKNIRKILNAASESQNIDFVKNVQDLFISNFESTVSKEILLEPLIKAHIFRNDLEGAVDEYKNCVMRHRVAPCLNLLLKKCIIQEAENKLQNVVDITSSYIRKNALHELAAAFVDVGKTLQAVKVIESLGKSADENYLEEICRKMYTQSKMSSLEQFIAITRDLKHINREKMYYQLLCLYSEKNYVEKAHNVFKIMQNENIEPSPKTARLLCQLFEKHNIPIPDGLHEKKTLSFDTEVASESNTSIDKFKESFLYYLKKEDAVSALEELNKMKKGYIRSITISELSQFIDLLVRNNCLLELVTNVYAMSYIIENAPEIFKPLLEKYAEHGHIESLNVIQNLLPDFALKKVFFNTFYSKAHLVCGKHEALLSQLEKNVDKKNKLFTIVAFEELLKKPEFEDRVVSLAKKYDELKFDVPISVVWAHYFMIENYSKAEEIQKFHSVAVEKVDSMILRVVRRNENVALARKFIDFLSPEALKPRVKERAYGAFLDVLVRKEMYDEAASVALEAEKSHLSLHKYYRSTLVTLKSALERENKAVLFNIPLEESEFAFTNISPVQ